MATNGKVREAILHVDRDHRRERERVELVDRAWIHRVLSEMAETSLLDAVDFDDDGKATLNIARLKEIPGAARRVDSLKLHADGKVEIRITPMDRIIRMAGEHIDVGAWVEKIEVEDTTGLAEKIQKGRQRARERMELLQGGKGQ